MRPVDAAPPDLETVRRILREHAPELEVRAFGSRVSWTARETSDLDLALMTDEPLDAARMAVLRAAFTDSRLPFRVDVVDWAGVSDGFRKVIESEYVTLVGKGERQDRRRWPRVTLGDCIQMNDSTYSPKEAWPFINYLDTGNITENRVDGIHHLIPGKDKIPSRARRKVQPGNILYSTVRPNQKHFGLLKEVPENFLASTGFSVFRGKAGIAHTGFIYWFLTQDHIVERLHTIAEHSTSAYPSIRPSDIEALTLALPPLPEQRAIAGVLGALDDRIDLNRRMSETLEAMARALFKSWFVDFDPVRARVEGRDTGLPDHIADLFPDRLADSELGEIPEGWAAVPLPDLIEINPTRPLRRNAVTPYLDMANMPTKGHAPDKIIDRPFGSGMRFINGDTLVARITPCLENGKTAYVDFLEQGQVGWGSTEYIVLRPKPPLPCEFAYCLARSNRFREFAIRNMTGTSGRQRVSAKVLARFVLPSPPDTVCSVFRQLIQPLIAQAREAGNEARTLATLRDALLPKLVSGEVRLGEAVERLESAA